ncbi:MAG: 50S ribosomal protein L11 methyltransferase [Desulfobacterales bacterium]|nr:50S ribosomal protein L11 methyltransferase [Desulfobacterales bacterium]
MSIPYKELYIYYVKGVVRTRDTQDLSDGFFIGNWQEEDSAFLFFTRPAQDRVAELVSRNPGLELVDSYSMSYSDWHGGEIRPFSAGRFYVAPPWEYGEPKDGSIPVLLDPGVVFGAGTHPTTRSCLEAVEIACDMGGPDSAIDLGTGTGLLGLAAAGLGCRRVLAVDNNFLAVDTARRNILNNRLDGRVLAVVADAGALVDCRADLLIANIHFDVMRRLIASPAFYEKKWFVLSGLLRSQARKVEELIYYGPGRILQRWISEGVWYTFLGTCCV